MRENTIQVVTGKKIKERSHKNDSNRSFFFFKVRGRKKWLEEKTGRKKHL